MANIITPPPVDNDPEPANKETKDKLRAFISIGTWASLKSWLNLVYKILKGVQTDTSGVTTINGLPAQDINTAGGGFGSMLVTQIGAGLPAPDYNANGVLAFLVAGPAGKKGQVIGSAFFTDAGSSTTSTSLVNVQAASFSYTPVSANSYLNIVWYFEGKSALLAATDTAASFQGFEVTSGNVALGSLYAIEVATSSGGNQTQQPCAICVPGLSNSALTTRIFELFAETSNAGSAASATSIKCIIQEIANQ